MSQAAAKKKTTATPASDGVDKLAASAAKQQFVSSALDMGWRLALTVLVPVFIGVQLDNRFNTSPSFTLAALFIAVVGACMVVSKTVKDVNKNFNPKGK